jgi:cardiolipin synthase
VIWLLLQERFTGALVLFALAGFSDALDGFLAKRYEWTSRLGERMDPLADKALLVSSYLALGWLQIIPAWLVLLVIVRDVVILVGAITYYFHIEQVDADPTFVSKLNTFAQILLVIAMVLNQDIWPLPQAWIPVLIYSVTATTILSGIDYVWTWGLRAWKIGRLR